MSKHTKRPVKPARANKAGAQATKPGTMERNLFRTVELGLAGATHAAEVLLVAPHAGGCPCLCCKYGTIDELADVTGMLRMAQAWIATHH